MAAKLDPFSRDLHCILGLPFDATDLKGAAASVRSAANEKRPFMVSTPNLNFLIACLSDETFRNSVIGSDLSLPDGTPLIWIAKLLRIPIKERVAGSDLFDQLRTKNGQQLSVFFFGGPEGAAAAACKNLTNESRGLRCAGFFYPGFASVEQMSTDVVLENINTSNADLLVVSLGAKKGQAWIEYNRARLRIPVVSHLGAVVNFVAGTVSRAPRWVRKIGFEWIWRIKEEPSLWRRYAADGFLFFKLLINNVIPHAFLVWHHTLTSARKGHAIVEIDDSDPNLQILRLAGPWVQSELPALRSKFTEASVNNKDICLDLRNVTYVDSACIGLLILLKYQKEKRGCKFSLISIPREIQRLIKFSCAKPLLTNTEYGCAR